MILLVVAIMLVVGAFFTGLAVHSPDDAALSRIDNVVPVFATAQQRVVDDGFTVIGRVVAPRIASVTVTEASTEASSTPQTKADTPDNAPANGDATPEQVVVSASAAKRGQTITAGTLIAEVSGRPVFAWPAGVPLYRNLVPGDSGADVRGLQQALADAGVYEGGRDGLFGARTLEALETLYLRAGYSLPFVNDGVRGFAWREVVTMPKLPALVTEVPPVGTVLGAERPLVSIQTSPAVIQGLATTDVAKGLHVGTKVRVEANGGVAETTSIQKVGAFMTDEKTGISGQMLTVMLPRGFPTGDGTGVTIRPAKAPSPSIAVPAISLRQDASGTFVLRKAAQADPRDSGNAYETIRVVASAEADGWVSLTDAGGLNLGDRVLVSGSPSE
ncbi:peptidoglycan-binding protein [Microbacterium protaetiae]|uniref:Peptidoglycan-binding protein n=1 Tax=Microbacterium protaetiae TaxID=2509458 RepID=A0A4P6EE53_9MICO|nr:peptidoglycan-binding domain-containing protein [Microbacterium protaetiae]QAY59633.1 peptidoglycan-binding protein [Microbacterium protaetiae]